MKNFNNYGWMIFFGCVGVALIDMNQQDADRQISQMIEFIKQEAREKAEEISIKTAAEANATKLNKIHSAKKDIKAEYEKKHKEIGTQKRIARSRMINDARFNRMRERNTVLDELKDEARAQLATFCKHAKYPDLIENLILEGLLSIVEKKIEIKCREEDLSIVEKKLPVAIKRFNAMIQKDVEVKPVPMTITINKQNFLPAGPKKGFKGVTCAGGIHLIARNGKIVCRNTLDSRFDAIFEDLLPAVREMLFGARAAPVREEKKEASHH